MIRTLLVCVCLATFCGCSSIRKTVNKGEPVVLSAPKSGVTQAMNQLADLFVPTTSGDKRRRK